MPEYPTADELDWECETIDTPGMIGALCELDALDWGLFWTPRGWGRRED